MNKISSKLLLLMLSFLLIFSVMSCTKFLNVVPDKTGTLKNAFRQKARARQYLYSIYYYLPNFADSDANPALQGGFEMWVPPEVYDTRAIQLALSRQSVVSPFYDYWKGANGGKSLYKGIRKANIFLNRIDNVGNMSEFKKRKWSAEVKFLKAYFYFYLIRMYGPVVLFKHNISINAPNSRIMVPRSPVDSCFAYVVKLLDEVIHSRALPARVRNPSTHLGRITKSIAYAVKAQVMITWASPLFNGNTALKGYENVNGENPFDTTYDPAKWDSAAVACKRAIEYVRAHGYHLFDHFNASHPLSDTTMRKMIIRQSFTAAEGVNRNNVIWAMPDEQVDAIQAEVYPYGFVVNSNSIDNPAPFQTYAPTLNIAKLFYTNHGVPIKQDISWDYAERFELRTSDSTSRFNIHLGYTTAKFNFDREPRFYADLAFDGSTWYGIGIFDDTPAKNLRYLRYKNGQVNSAHTHGGNRYSVTGYTAKKRLNYRTAATGTSSFSSVRYYWPQIRLAQLYLWYAEAKNEADGPGPQVYKYLNLVRKHAGIPPVQEAWSKWSSNPNQYKTKRGLRKIIHRETLIELAFEGKTFWNIRRWKEADKYLNQSIYGWNISASKAKNYYQKTFIYRRHFNQKDYFWPLSESVLNRNNNLTQNPGW